MEALLERSLDFLIQALVVLGSLSILIVLHEWGHFIVARWNGVQVLEFSMGMGKKLWSKMFRGTEYQFRLIPMGGFVRMAGSDLEGRQWGEFEKHEFYGVSAWRRLAIVLAGPIMNFLLAYLAFFIVLFISGEMLTKPIVGYVNPEHPMFCS